jgi:hypothetical protein
MRKQANIPKTTVSENASLFRVRRHAERHGLLVVQRKDSALGPLLVIDETTAEVLVTKAKTFGELAKRLGLFKGMEEPA